MIFFVPFIPVLISVFVAFIGVVLTVFYFLRIIRRSIPILKKSNTRASLQSFVRMHFPLIVAGLILILMLSTFLSAASFDDGKISVELTSRNFVYAPSDHNQQTISVRGPYTIDSALENETDILRVPHDALSTLEMSENDTMVIDGKSYLINGTKEEKPAQDVVSEEQTFNEQGELVMTIAQAEAVWTVKTGKTGYTVSGYTGKDETLFVPAYIDGKPVETIGKGKQNAVVKKVIIPGTIKKICTGAFPGYKQLADVVFTNEKVAIGDCAFTDCPLLLDENHCLVMRGVLHDSDQQGDVVIPGYVRVIPQSFMQKSSIKHMTSLTLMDGIEEIGQDAFNNCKELKKLVICDTVTEFFGGFSGCYSLETIDLGNSIERIPFAEFAFCKSLKRVTIGKNVKEIACQAFAECTALRDIYYNGTMEQWNSLRKVQNWDCNTSDLVIHCEDGDFENK